MVDVPAIRESLHRLKPVRGEHTAETTSTDQIRTTALDGFDPELSGPWTGYWMALLRVLVGYWFLHAGLTKVLFGFDAAGYLSGASRGAITEPLVQPFADGILLTFANYAVGWGELLIGLGLLVGALVRPASFFGAFLTFSFYFTNHGWANGMTNGDLWGLLLFVTLAVVGAGRVWGVDEYLERTDFARGNPWVRYLLG